MRSLVPALLALGSFASVVPAQFWPTVTATTNMGTWSTYNIANLTNGQGLSAMNLSATHSATWQDMWLTNQITTGWIQFDLGSIQPLNAIAVWNYNSSISVQRGVALMDVSWSIDGQMFFPLSQERPPQGTAQPIPPHVIAARGIPARYVKFDVLQNYGNNYTGLSEVQFVVNACKGTIVQQGTGCQDAGGTRNTMGYTGCPDLGTSLSLHLNTSVSAAGPIFLVLGLSDTSWGTVPLPLNLAPFGAPGCNTYVSPTLVLGAPPPVNGRATMPLAIPQLPHLFGGSAFLQFFHLNAGANALGLVTSDYVKITLG